MTILTDLTMLEVKKSLENKDFSAVELTNAYIDNIKKHKGLNCFITETFDRAIDDAKATDDRISKGESLKLLDGIPIAMKDLFCTKGILTTASSKILGNFIPTYESTVSQKLIDAGSVLLGKVALDEFAMGGSTKTSYYGIVKNPYKDKTRPDKILVPGGSSGGSSSAVAAGLALGATATDTGGSVRQPSAFTGIVGIKPTYGRVSRWGCVAFASSLDTCSVMGRNVIDAALMLQAVSGYDEKDSTSFKSDVPNWFDDLQKNSAQSLKGIKIGLPKEYFENISEELMNVMQARINDMKNLGAEFIDISLPSTKYALPVYYIIAPAEASANLARYDGVRFGFRSLNDNKEFESLNDMYIKTRTEGFGEEVKRRLMIGTAVLSSGMYDHYFLKAAKVRRIISNEFADAFSKVDVIMTPTATGGAFAVDDVMSPIDMYMNDVFTVASNLAGVPAISIPAGNDSKTGLPFGMQLIGKMFDESSILRTANIVEKTVAFDNRPSKLFC